MLEDTVSRLEARLLELENPESSSPSVVLHDPYVKGRRNSNSPPSLVPESPAIFAQRLSPFSPTSTTSSLPSGRHWNTFSKLATNTTELTGSSGHSASPLRYSVPMPHSGIEVRILPVRFCSSVLTSSHRNHRSVPSKHRKLLPTGIFLVLTMNPALTSFFHMPNNSDSFSIYRPFAALLSSPSNWVIRTDPPLVFCQ